MNNYIDKEIALFEKEYFKNIESGVDLIDKIVKYLCKHKGKMLRPKLAIYTANLIDKANDKTYSVASLVEMIHVATLIHDDIVDESYIRRGWPTISKVWKNKISVLVGDYLFSKALTKTVELGDLKSISILLVDPRIIFPADKATFSAMLTNSFFINSNLDGENYKGFYL